MKPTLKPGDRVHIEPVHAQALRPGDIVLIRNGYSGVLHRYLGRTAEGHLLTHGDNRRLSDTPWPPEALVGRVTAWIRANGATVRANAPVQRLNTGYRLLTARLWRIFYRLRALLMFLLVFFIAGRVLAAVTLTKFTATYQSGKVHLYWETASEVDLIGFYVLRAVDVPADYTRITEDIIPAEGSLVGAPYSYDDPAIQPGRTYYYLLEAEDTTGNLDTHGPVSVTIPGPTLTPTPGPSPTPTRTPTPGPSPTPTRTPIPIASPTPTPTYTPKPNVTPTRTATPLPGITPTHTATPLPGTTPLPATTSTATAPASGEMTPLPTPVPTATAIPSGATSAPPIEAPTPTRIPIKPTPTPASPPLGWVAIVLLLMVGLGGAFWWWRRR